MQIQAENTASVAAETVEAKAQLQVALARIETLEAALRFYADAENWRLNGPLDPNSGNFTGGPARAVIKKDRQP